MTKRRIPTVLRDLRRSPIYGTAVGEIVTAMGFGEEVKSSVFLFTNAFIGAYKRGELGGEYSGYSDFETLAWEEHYVYADFIKEVVRRIPGLLERDFPAPSSVFYVLRKHLPRALEKE